MQTTTLTPAPIAPTFTSARNPNGARKPVSPEAIANVTGQRLNVPFDAAAWDGIAGLTDDDRDLLRWFHQRVIGELRMPGRDVAAILGKSTTVASRVLSGKYPAQDWQPILAAIRAYRDQVMGGIESPRPQLGRQPEMVQTKAADTFLEAMDFASLGGFALIVGRSGQGKTRAAEQWMRDNPGRMARVNAPVLGGCKALLESIADVHGIAWRHVPGPELLRRLCRQLGAGRIIMIDEGTRLIPYVRKTKGTMLIAQTWEALKELWEVGGVGVVVSLTYRSADNLGTLAYQIEQVTSRARTFRAPEISRTDTEAIARQWGDFAPHVMDRLHHDLTLMPGGLRLLVSVLQNAERAAAMRRQSAISDRLMIEAIDHERKAMPAAPVAPAGKK